MFLTQAQDAVGINSFIYILYGGLIMFFIYKFYKQHAAAKSAKGEVFKFRKDVNKIMILLTVLITAFGIYNIFTGQVASGVIMLILIVILGFEYTSPNVFAENGFVIDGKFVEWHEVKKWGFDVERGELLVRFKKEFEEKQGVLRIAKKDIKSVEDLFRKYKLKK